MRHFRNLRAFSFLGQIKQQTELFQGKLVNCQVQSKILSNMFSYENSNLFLAGICFFKANNRDTRTMCEICSKLKETPAPERLD